MSLWWLEPGWKDATCARCGTNIWDSGGDPDHGVCFDCFDSESELEQRWPEPTEEDYCGMGGHEYHGNDSDGPRCYCGAVTGETVEALASGLRAMGGAA